MSISKPTQTENQRGTNAPTSKENSSRNPLSGLRKTALAAILAVGAAGVTPNRAEAACGPEHSNEITIIDENIVEAAAKTIGEQHKTKIEIEKARFRCYVQPEHNHYKVTIGENTHYIVIDPEEESTATEQIRKKLLQRELIPNQIRLEVDKDAKKELTRLKMELEKKMWVNPNGDFGVMEVQNLALDGKRMDLTVGTSIQTMEVTLVDSGKALRLRTINWDGTHQDLTCPTNGADCVIGEPSQTDSDN